MMLKSELVEYLYRTWS